MKRDKRKGLIAGYKKAGPTIRFTINLTILAFLLSIILFFINMKIGATKYGQEQAQQDRDIKHGEQLETLDEAKVEIKDSLGAYKRPHVFFKMTKLMKPLISGEKTTVEFILTNSGQDEANGFIRDFTYYFDIYPEENLIKYQKAEQVNFSLAPTAEWNGQFRSSFVPTEEMLAFLSNGKARLIFFAKGEYKDSQDRIYELPFCYMYDKDINGNLIICPGEVKFE